MSSKTFLTLSILVVSWLLPVSHSSGADAGSFARANAVLKSELKLAGKPGVYFIVDLEGRKVQIKAKGMVLKEMPIARVSLWGAPAEPVPLKLIKKSALIKPGRTKIKPGSAEQQASSEPDVLELQDMPSRYSLTLENNVRIYVRPNPDGVVSTVWYGISTIKKYVTRPLLSFWHALRRGPYTAIDIALEKKDAQALYWSFTEGSICIPAL